MILLTCSWIAAIIARYRLLAVDLVMRWMVYFGSLYLPLGGLTTEENSVRTMGKRPRYGKGNGIGYAADNILSRSWSGLVGGFFEATGDVSGHGLVFCVTSRHSEVRYETRSQGAQKSRSPTKWVPSRSSSRLFVATTLVGLRLLETGGRCQFWAELFPGLAGFLPLAAAGGLVLVRQQPKGTSLVLCWNDEAETGGVWL